jgi:multimeric flavodoxin WrbA
MKKHVLILKSSPRLHGNSSTLADQLAEGAYSVGAKTVSFDLHRMDIQPCDNCDGCQTTGECIIQDDMQKIFPEISKANAIVLAGPIYWFNINGQMKLCIDRWFSYQNQHWNNFYGKDAGIILTYADPYLQTAGGDVILKMYENLFQYLHMPIKGIVHGSLFEITDALNNQELMQEAFDLGVTLGKN